MDPTPSIEKVSAVRHLYPRPASKRSEDRGGKQTMGLKFIHCFSDRFPFPYLVFGKRNVFFDFFFFRSLSLSLRGGVASGSRTSSKIDFFHIPHFLAYDFSRVVVGRFVPTLQRKVDLSRCISKQYFFAFQIFRDART